MPVTKAEEEADSEETLEAEAEEIPEEEEILGVDIRTPETAVTSPAIIVAERIIWQNSVHRLKRTKDRQIRRKNLNRRRKRVIIMGSGVTVR